jgi:hypothetical protein
MDGIKMRSLEFTIRNVDDGQVYKDEDVAA